MDSYITLNVKKDTPISDVVYVPPNAPLDSLITDYTVWSLDLMEEELVMLSGMEINAEEDTLKGVKRMDSCGTLNVNLDSIM